MSSAQVTIHFMRYMTEEAKRDAAWVRTLDTLCGLMVE